MMNLPSSSQDLPPMSQLFKTPTPRKLSSEHHLSSQHTASLFQSGSSRQSKPVENSNPVEKSNSIDQSNPIQQSNQRRSFRPRKKCQIQPYTTETHKYLQALQSTDWQDAVVIMPRRPHKVRNDENDDLHEKVSESFMSDSSSSTPAISSSQIGQFCERSYKRRRRASSEGPRRPNQPRFRDDILDSQSTRPPKVKSRRKSPQCKIPVSKWLTPEPDDDSYTRQLDRTLSASASNVLHHTPQTFTPDVRISSPATSCPSHISPTPSPIGLRRTLSYSPERAHHHLSMRPPQCRQPDRQQPSSKALSKQKSTDAAMNVRPRVSVPRVNLQSLINSKNGNSTRSDRKKAPSHRASVLDLTLDSSPISNQTTLINRNDTTTNRSVQDPQPSTSYRPSVIKTIGKTPKKHAEKRKEFEETEDDDDEQEEETDDEELLREAVLPKKARLKLLGRMMPKSYVKKAAKDLKLMEQERQHGRLKLTLSGSDSGGSSGSESDRPTRTTKKTTSRPLRRPSISPPRNSRLNPSDESQLEPERPGITWAEKLVARVPSAQNANTDSSHDMRLNRYNSRRSSSPELRVLKPPSKKTRTHHPPEETELAISLKDDHALWRTHESANAIPSLNLAPPSIRAQQSGLPQIIPGPAMTSLINAFKDFTPDFSIQSLNSGIKIQSETNYLSGGYLYNLLNIIQDHGLTQVPTVDIDTEESREFFGESFSPAMSPNDFVKRLIHAADLIQDELNLHLALDSARTTGALSQMSHGFRFFGDFVSRQRPTTTSMMTAEVLTEGVRKWTDEIIDRLDDLALDSVNRPEFSKLMLIVSWGLFELACRLYARVGGSEIVERATVHLIRRLLEYGPPHTMCRLKEAMKDPLTPITDLSIEIWVSLINIVVITDDPPRRAPCLAESQFWNTLMEQTRQFSEKIGLIGPVAQGEAQGYIAMSLCTFSQFLPDGISGKGPQMGAHWSVIRDLLDNLSENLFVEGLSRLESDRRDCYVRSIFGRALLFHERWNWKLVFQDGMLQQFYKILNQVKCQQLPFEINHPRRFGGPYAFPEVLDNLGSFQLTQWGPPEGLGGQPLRDGDTCFGIFLKLILASAKSLQWPLDATKRSEIDKIVSCCNPARQLNFAPLEKGIGLKNEKITDQHRSALIQMFSLILIYISILPKSLRRHLSCLERIYQFEQVDEPTRLCHFQIWKKSNEILSWCEFKANTIVEKFSIPMKVLFKEFDQLNQRKQIIKGTLNVFSKSHLNYKEKEASENDLKKINEEIKRKIKLIERCLETVEEVMRNWREIEMKKFIGFEFQWVYPDLIWLDPAWSTELNQNEIFREGSIGRLANRIIKTFLDQRDLAIQNLEKMEIRLKEVENTLRSGEGDEEDEDGIELRKDIESLAKREKGLIEVIDDRLVNPICGFLVLMNNSNETLEEKKKKGMVELIECWARLDQIKRRNGIEVENWMNQLKIKDEKNVMNFIGIKDEMNKIMVGLKYMILTMKFEKEGINQNHQIKEDLISLWFTSIVINELHFQEEFTKEIIKIEKEILPSEKIKEIIEDDNEDGFEVKRIHIIQEVMKKFIREGKSIETRKYIGIMSETICKSYGELLRKKTLGKDLIDRYLNGIIKSFVKSITEDPQSWIDWNSVPKLRMLKKFY
ncbi:Mus7/MMS22 family-domain-containing protein [Melampsora americana]|nr:Mus7/MMS22 family-domain-containing protein [Melampsora americana]